MICPRVAVSRAAAAICRSVRLNRLMLYALLIGLMAADPPLASGYDVKPGDVITTTNAYKVKDLVSPGNYWKVVNGMTMEIVPTEHLGWPPPYREATEKYSAQARLSKDRRSLVNYVAGQPFPFIDVNDPDAAVKIIWDYMLRPMYTDDLDARSFACMDAYAGPDDKLHRQVDYEEIGHYYVYNNVGRVEVNPMPTDPDFEATGRYFLSALYPVLAPADAHGQGFLRFRYADPHKGDNAWIWQPGSRRFRRINEAFLTGSPGAGQFYPDDREGFSAKPENYDWRLLGEQTMLGAVNVERVPAKICITDGGGSACPERWQLRRLYIVEATPRRSRASEELFSKHVLYIDAEAWVVLAHDSYDRRGQLYKTFVNYLAYRDRPVPNARIAIYPFKRLFEIAESTSDVQSGLSETCFLPTPGGSERETWYINMGAATPAAFTQHAVANFAY